MLEGAASEEPTVRQASVYGLGQCAEKAPAAFAPVCADALKVLRQLAAAPTARDEENSSATDNVIGALGRIAQSLPNHPAVKPAELLALWVAELPLKEDEVEARCVHRQLCALVKAGNTALLGPNPQQHLPRVAKVLVQILASNDDLMDKATIQVARELMLQMPQQTQQQAVQQLTPKQQQTLQKKLEG